MLRASFDGDWPIVMKDEQRHTRMHIERASALGITFGELPVNCYIWKKAQSYESVLDYLAGLPLTFETRNLDHTVEFETAFLAAGDRRSAAVMRRIHEDEIEHVRFGIEWLHRLKAPGQTDWESYLATCIGRCAPKSRSAPAFNSKPAAVPVSTRRSWSNCDNLLRQIPTEGARSRWFSLRGLTGVSFAVT
jgi:uncharacterized ferritin-like protein (DUF455 family)